MKLGLGKSLVLMVALAAGALEIGIGFINTFAYDFFGGCADGTYAADDWMCEYAPQLSIYAVAAVMFFVGTLVLLHDKIRKATRRTVVKAVAHSLWYFALLVFTWRMQVSLGENFLFFSGEPMNWSEQLYVAFVWMDTLLIGLFMGFIWWLPEQIDNNAKTRKEPRVDYKKLKK